MVKAPDGAASWDSRPRRRWGVVMDEQAAGAYLARIGVPRPAALDAVALDAAMLRTLHRAHLMTVPFENLSIHLSEPISLAAPDLLDKIVTSRRGGFCYELNGAFGLLLEALGARVDRLAARVQGEGGLGPPFDHLALVVHLADGTGPWLADVGFGTEQRLAEADVLAAYRDHFGITLDRIPG
jgi:N-hydroxyarylamine O-acetyltransferase